MKRWIWALLLLPCITVKAQIKDVVKWDYSVDKIDSNIYEAVLTGTIEEGWHLYSQDLPKNSGIPTTMKITSGNVETVGTVEELGKKIEEFSEAFGVQIIYYSDSVKFVQQFRMKQADENAKISAEITFQVCNDKICLAPNTLEFEQPINNTSRPAVNVADKQQFDTQINTDSIKVSSLDFKHPLINCGTAQPVDRSGNGLVFFLGFLGGFIALLTPCVFPMIPLTVSFFTKSASGKINGRRNALLYGLFILVIFLALSIPFHIVDGISGNIFNEISTSTWLNIFFFVVFLFLHSVFLATTIFHYPTGC
ncbi:protein-disulfide reductase DsbD domain-containing protein [Parafilimonas sp.]|uniref:protein-disulfide reductase DsbD domain-containing protein n=1 Tax=Parafilimonas sp. TaxID=1969739 RepID=UPI003F805AAB